MLNTSAQRIHDYLQAYFAEHGYSPTLREIAEGSGYTVNTVYGALSNLQVQGVIECKESGSRRVVWLAGYKREPLRGLPELPPVLGLARQPLR